MSNTANTMESEIVRCFTNGSASRDEKNEMMMLLVENQFNSIILSGSSTKLSDLFMLMLDIRKFSDFLNNLQDVNIRIPLDSPIWPGYSLLHLCMILKENIENNVNLPETNNNMEQNKEAMHNKRVELCLERGCSVDTKNTNGQTPIHLAFSHFRKAAVEQLLHNSESNAADANGLSHLHIACLLGNVDAVKKYVRTGADVNSRVNSNFNWPTKCFETSVSMTANSTPLHLAVEYGNEELVEYLLKQNADVYAQDSLGFTPIHLSMAGNRWALARMLFKATPNLRDSVSLVGLSHLHVATWANDQEAVDKLLINGAQVDRVIEADAKKIPFLECHAGKTALLVAAYWNRDKAANSLLEAGANMDTKDLKGVSALQHALRNMCNVVATPFVRMVKGGKGDVESCGFTLLHVACAECDVDWAKRLIEEGADVNARISDEMMEGATALHILLAQAVLTDFFDTPEFVDMVKLLLDNGADVTLEYNGSTPLHLIFENHNYDDSVIHLDGREFLSRAVDLLLMSLKTYNVNPVNYQGFSHFHLACVRDDVETARQFLDHGVNVNAAMDPSVQESLGFSPLHFAMAHRSRDVAYLLLKRGADVNAKDVLGNTPLHVAIKRNFVDFPLIEVMINRGADVLAKNASEETILYLLWKDGGVTA